MLLQNYYGHSDTDSIQKIVDVYNELGLYDKLQSFKKEIYGQIMEQTKVFPKYFQIFVDEVYHLVANNPEGLGKVDQKENLRHPVD